MDMEEEKMDMSDGSAVEMDDTDMEDHVTQKPPTNKGRRFVCGVVEGFYGRPWTTEQRKDLFSKMQKWKMNSYIYAPKDDCKHRAFWRQPYTPEEAKHLGSLISLAKSCDVDFYYAISPGQDIVYSSSDELSTLKVKLDQVSQLGCECYALLFDDIESEMCKGDKEVFSSFAQAQVHVTNIIYEHLNQPKFMFCPTQYCKSRAVPSITDSEYLNTIGENLSPAIDVMWTGDRVVSKNITCESLKEINRVLKRKVVIWDNIHANDYDHKRIFLGPYSGRCPSMIEVTNGVMTNPNCQYDANFIAFHTLAQWSQCKTSVNTLCLSSEKLNTQYKSTTKSTLSTMDYFSNPPQFSNNNNNDDVYDPSVALSKAIRDWLPEFQLKKLVWGPMCKPQIGLTPQPTIVIPTQESVNSSNLQQQHQQQPPPPPTQLSSNVDSTVPKETEVDKDKEDIGGSQDVHEEGNKESRTMESEENCSVQEVIERGVSGESQSCDSSTLKKDDDSILRKTIESTDVLIEKEAQESTILPPATSPNNVNNSVIGLPATLPNFPHLTLFHVLTTTMANSSPSSLNNKSKQKQQQIVQIPVSNKSNNNHIESNPSVNNKQNGNEGQTSSPDNQVGGSVGASVSSCVSSTSMIMSSSATPIFSVRSGYCEAAASLLSSKNCSSQTSAKSSVINMKCGDENDDISTDCSLGKPSSLLDHHASSLITDPNCAATTLTTTPCFVVTPVAIVCSINSMSSSHTTTASASSRVPPNVIPVIISGSKVTTSSSRLLNHSSPSDIHQISLPRISASVAPSSTATGNVDDVMKKKKKNAHISSRGVVEEGRRGGEEDSQQSNGDSAHVKMKKETTEVSDSSQIQNELNEERKQQQMSVIPSCEVPIPVPVPVMNSLVAPNKVFVNETDYFLGPVLGPTIHHNGNVNGSSQNGKDGDKTRSSDESKSDTKCEKIEEDSAPSNICTTMGDDDIEDTSRDDVQQKNDGMNPIKIQISNGDIKSQSCEMEEDGEEVEITTTKSNKNNDVIVVTENNVGVEHMEVEQVNQQDNTSLSESDLHLLSHLHYLPADHGPFSHRLLSNLYWIKVNAHKLLIPPIQSSMMVRVVGGSDEERGVRECNDVIEEWRQRAEQFHEDVSDIQSLFFKLCGSSNKQSVYDLYTYMWDISTVTQTLSSFVKWLGKGVWSERSLSHVVGQRTWFSGTKEAFLSGNFEPWVFRGGLASDLERLLPIDAASDLYECSPPEMPINTQVFIRPVHDSSVEQSSDCRIVREVVKSALEMKFGKIEDKQYLDMVCDLIVEPTFSSEFTFLASIHTSASSKSADSGEDKIIGFISVVPDITQFKESYVTNFLPHFKQKYASILKITSGGEENGMTRRKTSHNNVANKKDNRWNEFIIHMKDCVNGGKGIWGEGPHLKPRVMSQSSDESSSDKSDTNVEGGQGGDKTANGNNNPARCAFGQIVMIEDNVGGAKRLVMLALAALRTSSVFTLVLHNWPDQLTDIEVVRDMSAKDGSNKKNDAPSVGTTVNLCRQLGFSEYLSSSNVSHPNCFVRNF